MNKISIFERKKSFRDSMLFPHTDRILHDISHKSIFPPQYHTTGISFDLYLKDEYTFTCFFMLLNAILFDNKISSPQEEGRERRRKYPKLHFHVENV